jgi:hypothetical protein
VKGQIKVECGGCDITCEQYANKELDACPGICHTCVCRSGYVIDTTKNQCVKPKKCPDNGELLQLALKQL